MLSYMEIRAQGITHGYNAVKARYPNGVPVVHDSPDAIAIELKPELGGVAEAAYRNGVRVGVTNAYRDAEFAARATEARKEYRDGLRDGSIPRPVPDKVDSV
jgi:hypothetical protein